MSKLLFITQKVDKEDDVLGIYHTWIEELSNKITTMNVICLYKGRNELPSNIGVFSLGKENADSRGLKRGLTRIKYVIRFYKYIWNLRDEYETVFVHMNPIYIVLGGFFWKLFGKKILLWYNHPMGNLTAKTGIAFANIIFCTSPQAFVVRYKKTRLMPAGIDTDLFKPIKNVEKKQNRILYLGRISPIKNIDILINAAKILDSQDIDFELLIIGSPASESDKIYEKEINKISHTLVELGKVVFKPAIPNYKTPEIYNECGVFVNLTPSGSLDKTTLEAMSCEIPVIVSNKAFNNILPEEFIFTEKDATDLSIKIKYFFSRDISYRKNIGKNFRGIIVEKHSLGKLVNELLKYF